ncbi:MAG TPA: 2-polyprenyl-3-methyl-6-methoxy-1,4-benzoquinone monooxygenase [Xanthomonadales bacterium]|nr:2-polyprenyl-3-methyl-6-methoxy-1,4-benzoquinone monooxygenase [Xanthomonadales bacterium]
MSARQVTRLDRFIIRMDEALRLSSGAAPEPNRPNPASEIVETGLDSEQRQHVAGLMRVNHAGEICAQALYAGQATTARHDEVRQAMKQAADEEMDHLSWCESRLEELDSQTSLLNPLWYAGSFAIGAVAGLAGDRWSLGFVRETENQVEAHLQEHLDRLPEDDHRSRAILDQMKTDEAQHASMAEAAGGQELPRPIRSAMAFTAGIMKALAYRI